MKVTGQRMLQSTLTEEIYETSGNLQEITFRSIILQLLITWIKIKTNRDLQKNGRAVQRSPGSPKEGINSIWVLWVLFAVLISTCNPAMATTSVVLVIEVQFALAPAKPRQEQGTAAVFKAQTLLPSTRTCWWNKMLWTQSIHSNLILDIGHEI